MKFFKRPTGSSASLEPLRNFEGPIEALGVNRNLSVSDDNDENDNNNGHNDDESESRSPALRERSASLSRLEMSAVTESSSSSSSNNSHPTRVARSASEISLASTVAIDSFIQSYNDCLAVRAEQMKIQAFIKRQTMDTSIRMNAYVDFVGHQIVEVLNTIMRYKDTIVELRAIYGDTRPMKKEFSFFSKINFNILPTFRDVVALVNEYSQSVAYDIQERYSLCLEIVQKLSAVNVMISDLMAGDDFFDRPRSQQTQSLAATYVHQQDDHRHPKVMEMRLSLIGFSSLHESVCQMFRRINPPGSCSRQRASYVRSRSAVAPNA